MTAQETELFERIKAYGGPGRNVGNTLDFYPSDDFLIQLTVEYNAESASVFTMGKDAHFLWVGTRDTIILPIALYEGEHEILIKHTHPRGTESPSRFDIEWLVKSQNNGSPQIKSLILPIGKNRISFNRNTPYL
ncbi:hypothetical protein [Flagellimonas sp.]|uniref:hypothetical protein n=1 Tax=Flagellimonas sp. TaxID=2058762 RepID=UPI003BAA142D